MYREEMSSQIPWSGDRLRTNWTTAMERYFIDLMLEQVHWGNRMGYTFNKQAWNDMLIMFNTKFGSSYDVNVLKSRYTILWKQFNDIKNILDHNGFCWDNTRQMVIAEKSVWDVYIKAHPDAQSYRNKVLINFNDFCLVFAHTKADGRYSLSSHDIDYDDDIQAMNVAAGANILLTKNKERPKAHWTPAMDHHFVKLMLGQVRKGNMSSNRFKRRAWKDLVILFNAKFRTKYGESFLKHRYKKLSKYYINVKNLLEESGFSWDERQQKILADDDIWDRYIKEHPDARFYRRNSLLNYQDLDLIYGNSMSNGRCSDIQRWKNSEDSFLWFKNGEERKHHSVMSNGHLSHSEDLDSEGPDRIIEEEELESHVNADCLALKTEWTPSMERCFIDFMLQKEHKMSRIGYNIDNQAWIDMVTVFKDRFGSKQDKDIFRSHYKRLEKQYLDMKDLLERGGFWWDESEQMITESDDVWDAYIEEHPEAEIYKTKPMPNYNDLCLIYGSSTTDAGNNPAEQAINCNGNGFQFSDGYCQITDWTPPLDRFFIDLMLEQVRNGSVVHHGFRKQAWTDMIAKFSAEFGSRYGKDVLKSRFLNLRRRFSDMKMLLDQSGFAWDEMQQRITADDGLWDAYVKDHPDARSYRNRTLPNFNDLYFIYGNTSIVYGDCYSAPSMDSDSEDGDLGIKFVGEEDNPSPANTHFSSVRWMEPMDRYFIDLMLEQVHKGNKTGSTFDEQAWVWMTLLFNEKFGLHYDIDALENRYFSLLKQYEQIRDTNHNCLDGKEIQQLVKADIDVMRSHKKEHPDAISIKERILENYRDLDVIFGNGVAHGRPSPVIKMETYIGTMGLGFDNIFGDLMPQAKKSEISDMRKRRKSTTSSRSACSKKVQRIVKEKLEETYIENPRLVDGVTGYEDDYIPIERIVDALQTVPDMNDELSLEACKLLEDGRNAKMFVAMDVSARRKWLLRKLQR